MKKLTIIFFFGLLLISHVFSQSCLPEGIICYSQSYIDDFLVNNPDCTEIEGDVTIGYDGYTTDITNLDGFSNITRIHGTLYINTNENLSDFNGLNSLESVGGDLIIENNDGITDMTGFDALTTIGGELYVLENDNQLTFNGMGALTTINELLMIGHSLNLQEFTGLSSLTYVGGIEIWYVHQMPNMTGFSSLTQIDGNLIFNSCHGLTDLTGLNLVESINGMIKISGAQSLESLTGLEGLTSVGGDLNIMDNDAMTSIAALSNLTLVGGNLSIRGNLMLESLQGLEALTSIGADLNIGGNSTITNLAGIDNIAPQSILNLTIEYNPSLAVCEVQSVCDYLQSPGGVINIRDNATGCASETEVRGACGAGIDDIGEHAFTIYPNPASNKIEIQSNENPIIEKVVIYDQMGREVMIAERSQETMDISALSNGIYIISISTEKGDTRIPFVKE